VLLLQLDLVGGIYLADGAAEGGVSYQR